jgi:hypothetical protein
VSGCVVFEMVLLAKGEVNGRRFKKDS